MSTLFLVLSVACALWGVVSMIVMTAYLAKHGAKVSILFLRFLALKYISQYHEITSKESGKTGPWFYSYILSMNLAFVSALLGIIFK